MRIGGVRRFEFHRYCSDRTNSRFKSFENAQKEPKSCWQCLVSGYTGEKKDSPALHGTQSAKTLVG